MKLKKNFLLFIILLVHNTFALAQNYQAYYELINKGDWELEYNKDTAAFFSAYDKAFALADPFIDHQIKFVKHCALQNKWDKVKELLEQLMLKGYPIDGLKSKGFEKTAQYNDLKKREKELFNSFLVSINFDLYEKVKYLSDTDQYLVNEAENNIDTLWRTMREKVMLHNYHKLLAITKESGFPGERVLGFFNTKTSGIIAVHNVIPLAELENDNESLLLYVTLTKEDIAAIEELRNFLKPLVMTGEVSPALYLQLVDPIVPFMAGYWNIQYYGERIDRRTRTFFPIWDILNVDKRRAEIGLPPLYEYAMRKGIELPNGYVRSETK